MALLSALALACLLVSTGALSTAKVWGGSTRSNRTCSSSAMSFDEFVRKYNRGYQRGSSEYLRRRQLYEERVRHIDGHNCNEEAAWTAGINKLADWTELELKSLRGYRGGRPQDPSLSARDLYSSFNMRPARSEYPESWSWANLRAIRQPRDQLQCGSCWAFASEQVLRAHAEIKGWPSNFSVGQILSCTPNPHECGGTGGCNGATVELAFDYVMRSGLLSEDEIPYSGSEVTCPDRLKSTPAVADGILDVEGNEVHMLRSLANPTSAKGHNIGMVGWTKFPENRIHPMLRALIEEGPIAVAVAAGRDWNWYDKGIMLPSGCDTQFVISHAVVLFGYGQSGKKRFWNIKNSWGAEWGEHGNIRLQRLEHEESYCGWDKEPEVGSGCRGGPAQVWACGSCGLLYDMAMPHFAHFSGKI